MNISFKSLWSRRPDGWTAFDCQGGLFGVSVRWPQRGDKKPRVTHHASFPGQVLDAALLGQMGRSLHMGQYPILSILGRKEYQMFMVDKPVVRAEELESSLRWTVSPMIDYPPTEANLAWIDIPARQTLGNRTSQLYVVTARQSLINTRMSLFEQARVPMSVVDVREMAQRNIATAMGAPDAAICMVFAEPNGVQLTVTHQGELYLERFIGETLFEASEDEPSNDHQNKALDRVALEIQRCIDYVRRNYPSLPMDRVVVGPTHMDIGLNAQLDSRLIEPVVALNLRDVFDWPAGSELDKPQMQAQYFHALGATLRMTPKD